jgi:ATP-dependent DNA helicase RecQ
VAYYQQVGRAGRATDRADVLLLPGAEDREIWHYFATNAMPTEARADAVLTALAESDRPLSAAAIEARVDLRRSQLELLLKVLAVDGVVEYVQGGWLATGRGWAFDKERYDRIAESRVAEQRAMLAYQNGASCRMAFLTGSLDDPDSAPCGRCDACAGPWYPTGVSLESERGAQATLERVGVEIAPRALWPQGLDRVGVTHQGAPVKGKIPAAEQVEEGRVIARLTDLGYGNALRELFAPDRDGRPMDRALPPALASACLRVLKEWDWAERPVAVVWVPSVGRPGLVEALATGIARAGRLEPLGPLALHADASLSAVNSAYRVRDLWSRFSVPPAMASRLASLRGPVLLVDDLIDSRWTVTVAGRLLRQAGADAVLPLALGSVG